MKLNKNASTWQDAPLWVRLGMLGISSRKTARYLEIFSVIAGTHGLILFSYTTSLAHLSTILFWAGAYWLSASGRYIDVNNLWERTLTQTSPYPESR